MERDKIEVLLVEDNRTDVKLLRKVLSQRTKPRFRVTDVGTLNEAMAIISDNYFDIVLLDMNLPDCDCYRTLDCFKQADMEMPVVILTGINDREFAVNTLAKGAQDYLIKGQTDDELLCRVILYAIERNQIKNRLIENENQIKLFVQHSPVAMAIFDKNMRYLMTSQRWLDDYNIKKEDTIGEFHYDILTGISEKWKQLHKKSLQGESLKSDEDLIVFPDGRNEWIRWEMHPWRTDTNEIGGIIIVREIITLRKKTEEELIRYKNELEKRVDERTQELNTFYAHLEKVREEERTSIAREVHDELGQALTALKMDVAWLEKHQEQPVNDIQHKLDDMSVLITSTIKSIQKICSQLRPGILDDLGLVAALEWQMDEFHKRSGIVCKARIDFDDENLDQTYTTAIFRIFQETLTNILRHAQATEVAVQLVKDEEKIIFDVKDNGIGIDPQKIKQSDSFGLIGIRERVKSINGNLAITGQPDQGTTIKISLPLNSKGLIHA